MRLDRRHIQRHGWPVFRHVEKTDPEEFRLKWIQPDKIVFPPFYILSNQTVFGAIFFIVLIVPYSM